MKIIVTIALLSVSIYSYPISVCHISGEEVDYITTNTQNLDLILEEGMQDFLDEFDFTITATDSMYDDSIEDQQESLSTKLSFFMRKTALYCFLKLHYASEWLFGA